MADWEGETGSPGLHGTHVEFEKKLELLAYILK